MSPAKEDARETPVLATLASAGADVGSLRARLKRTKEGGAATPPLPALKAMVRNLISPAVVDALAEAGAKELA